MKNLFKYMAFALIIGVLFTAFGAAAENELWTKTFNVVSTVFKNVRVIVYILGAFGLIGIAVMAILGKMQFKWLAYLAIGLAIVAAADLVVSYAISPDTTKTATWQNTYVD